MDHLAGHSKNERVHQEYRVLVDAGDRSGNSDGLARR
jgi:hypothetical protein